MKRPIIDRAPDRWMIRFGWFVGLWAAGVAALGVVAYALHKLILG